MENCCMQLSVLPLNMLWAYFANFRQWVFISFGKMGTFDLADYAQQQKHRREPWRCGLIKTGRLINDGQKTKSL